jgi:hypothetical protein
MWYKEVHGYNSRLSGNDSSRNLQLNEDSTSLNSRSSLSGELPNRNILAKLVLLHFHCLKLQADILVSADGTSDSKPTTKLWTL